MWVTHILIDCLHQGKEASLLNYEKLLNIQVSNSVQCQELVCTFLYLLQEEGFGLWVSKALIYEYSKTSLEIILLLNPLGGTVL